MTAKKPKKEPENIAVWTVLGMTKKDLELVQGKFDDRFRKSKNFLELMGPIVKGLSVPEKRLIAMGYYLGRKVADNQDNHLADMIRVLLKGAKP